MQPRVTFLIAVFSLAIILTSVSRHAVAQEEAVPVGPSLVGTWTGRSNVGTWQFLEDGTLITVTTPHRYTVLDASSIQVELGGRPAVVWNYAVSDDTLVLSDPSVSMRLEFHRAQ